MLEIRMSSMQFQKRFLILKQHSLSGLGCEVYANLRSLAGWEDDLCVKWERRKGGREKAVISFEQKTPN